MCSRCACDIEIEKMDYYGYENRSSYYGRITEQQQFINPEYYDEPEYGAYGYEPQRTHAIDSDEDPASKRRKLDSVSMCVDYIRGYCSRGSGCMKAHVDSVSSISEREILSKTKFCHDFQNRGSCVRASCKFLHVTRKEEDEFLLVGTIPQTVFDRARSNVNVERMPPPRRGGGGMSRGRPGGGGMGRGPGGPLMGRGPGGPPMGRGPRYDTFDYDDDMRGSFSRSRRESERSSFQPSIAYKNYCIDFLKGTCTKNDQCPLIHCDVVTDMEHRDSLVKNIFCHDFQNRRCPRQHCKYMHATVDEQRIFIKSGYLPQTVRDRNSNKIFNCDLCIDNLRSHCIRGNSCQYRHVTVVPNKEERVFLSRSIFCHDFQENSCPRGSCKLLHTGKGDETFFIENGYLPDHLKRNNPIKEGMVYDPTLEAIADTVCRDFVKGVCNRGVSCKFYHPTPDELERLIPYQKNKGRQQRSMVNNEQMMKPQDNVTAPQNNEEVEKLKKENEALKQRIQQLERLLADACHCITLAVGDTNPTIKTLMDTIAGMAPESALANNNMPSDTIKQESN